MFLRVASICLCVAVLRAAPVQDREVVVQGESPAQAVREAIRNNPAVAEAVQSNSSQLYLLKTVSFSLGTASDLDLPPEKYLPEGEPDRVRENGMTIFSSPSSTSASTSSVSRPNQEQNHAQSSKILVELVPVSAR